MKSQDIWIAACAGVLFQNAMMGMRQDLYGLERYIEVCRAAWISPWIGWPLNVATVIATLGWLIIMARKESKVRA